MMNAALYKVLTCPVFLLLVGFSYQGCRQPETTDTSAMHKPATRTVDTLDVCGTPFQTFYDSSNLVYLLTLEGDTVYRTQNYYQSAEVIDFNLDGCPDIKINVYAKANLTEILLFDKDSYTYRALQQSCLPAYIAGTDLWYEFEPAGCASMRWRSTLYKLKNFESFKIAEMLGVSCEGEKKGIFVESVAPDGKTQLVEEFKVDAWEAGSAFVAEYWRKNYQKFD
jgi:hypothetical protein